MLYDEGNVEPEFISHIISYEEDRDELVFMHEYCDLFSAWRMFIETNQRYEIVCKDNGGNENER